jgi:DNA-binding GntR family transcriptional regulator
MSIDSQRQRVVSETRAAILSGAFKAGEALSERALGEAAGMSRVPVREALIQLEGCGLVQFINGRGAVVRTFGLNEIRDLYEVRESLESRAAALAAGHIDTSALEPLECELRALLAAKNPSAEKAQQVGSALHDLVLVECRNALLKRLLTDIRDQIQLSRTISYRKASRAQVIQGVKEHLALIRALRDGDGERAGERMRVHIAAWRSVALA